MWVICSKLESTTLQGEENMNYEMIGLIVGLILQTVIIIGVMRQSDARFDAQTNRIDDLHRDFNACIKEIAELRKETWELIKKIK